MSQCLKFPYEIKEFDINVIPENLREKFKKLYGESFVRVGPNHNYVQPALYKKVGPEFYNFKVRPDDVWIVGVPRSGTTMSEELVWLLCNDLDFKKASETIIAERVPFFDLAQWSERGKHEKLIELKNKQNKIDATCDLNSVEAKPNHLKIAERQGRRYMKTHLPLSLLPPDILTAGCKVLYLARNWKDVVVSLYFAEDFLTPNGCPFTMSEYVEIFYKGWRVNHLEHVKEGWKHRNNKNLMFVFYEELNKDLRGTIKRYADFLEKKLSEEDLDKLVDHFQIDNFRKNNSVNNQYLQDAGLANTKKKNDFIRKGKVGGWKEHLDKNQVEKIDRIYAESLEGIGLKFPE